ncbi:3-methyl-2-oxobutanoate hydroxymethyltransferase [Kocuria sp. HSID16901]|uniref:3-methyl-2-oxobutanoate hydroxymethyltransferase n=1 Tax=Kocuria sp. HSID16901 TaxID=2419505 RepID=UPI00069FB910|nr:3-methyl-2-oxobutanoate hydroxymethyltransferase [Kocuria sp. HSID16901]MCT1368443.1 3-methyl-2-oxobutanoate hydroxymethyltransferase [Rothia sp. p3-SID1597]
MASYLQDRDDQTPHADDWLSAVRRVRTTHLQRCKDLGHRFSMLTSYDALTAEIFDAAGIEVLLIGDSAGNTVFGYESTLPVTLDELIPLTRAVSRAAQRALVIVDLPFGTYEESPAQAVASAVRLMKEGEAHAVKMEGGAYYAEHVRAMVQAGIPVMAHVGFTPQSTNALGGFRVQGRAEAASRLIEDATALEAAGAFAVLAEMSAEDAVRAMDEALTVPTVGIGAGRSTTGQVLVWQDMAGLTTGKTPRFVKKYADVRSVITDAASSYRKDVLDGSFPAEAHVFRE